MCRIMCYHIVGDNMKEEYSDFKLMKEKVEKKGCLYQYRGCGIDLTTVYDLENLRNEVLYARSPVYMNDPFDSTIAIDENKLLNEMCDMILDCIDAPQFFKSFMKYLIKVDKVKGFATFISDIKLIQNKINQLSMVYKKRVEDSYYKFYEQNENLIYTKFPKDIKNKYNSDRVKIIVRIIDLTQGKGITEESIKATVNFSKIIDDTRAAIVFLREGDFKRKFREVQERMMVTCLSASGWDNELMWSHYAGAYKGMCVEYDFSKMNECIGIVNEVKYCEERPSLSLKEIGLNKVIPSTDENGKTIYKFQEPYDIDVNRIMDYLFCKHDVWDYEEEWRIVFFEEVGKTHRFINVPFIKSVTFGYNINPICKYMIIDICSQKNIEVYELKPSDVTYSLEREKVNNDIYNKYKNDVLNYIKFLVKDFGELSPKLEKQLEGLANSFEIGSFDDIEINECTKNTIKMLSESYFYKKAIDIYYFRFSEEFDEQAISSISELNNAIDTFIYELKGLCDTICSQIESVEDDKMNIYLNKINEIKSIIQKIDNLNWPF